MYLLVTSSLYSRRRSFRDSVTRLLRIWAGCFRPFTIIYAAGELRSCGTSAPREWSCEATSYLHDPQPPPVFIRNIAETEKIGCVERARKSRKAGCVGAFGFGSFGSLAAVARNCRGASAAASAAVLDEPPTV